MGKINVVLDDGSVKTVDEEDYIKSRGQGHVGTAQTSDDAIARKAEDDRREKARGLQGASTALVTSALDTASFGLIGKALAAYNPDEGQFIADSRQEHPTADFVGGVAGFALPGAPGIAAAAGKAVKGATGFTAAGRAVEGGLFGIGGHIAHTNVTGDPLSIEGLATDIGIGAVLNMGIGAVADRLRAPAKAAKGNYGPSGNLTFEPVTKAQDAPFARAARARAKLDAANAVDDGVSQIQRDYEVVPEDAATLATSKKTAAAAAREAKDQLKQMTTALDETPSYGDLQAAHKASRGAATEVNSKIAAEQEAYDAFASPKGSRKAIKDFEAVQARLREQLTAVSDITSTKAANEANAKLAGEGSDFGTKAKTRPGRAVAPHNEPVGISPAPEDSFAGKFGAGKADHVAPVTDKVRLTNTLKEMTEAKALAKKYAAAGDYEAAADTMEAMQPKVKEWLPDEVIEFPLRPLDKPVEVPPELPKKLSEIGKLRAETIGKIAQGLDENGVASLNRLATDLGLAPGETAADTLTEMHKQIRKNLYLPSKAANVTADDVVLLTDEVTPLSNRDIIDAGTKPEAWEAASAEVDAQRSTGGYEESKWMGQKGKGKVAKAEGSLLDGPITLAKTGAVMAAGRMADRASGYGVLGVFSRLLAGRATASALEQIEFSVGSAAVASKIGIRAKISEAFARFAKPVGDTLEFFGPVTASLKAGFPSGVPDESNDERVQAVNRSHDLTNAQVTGPDTLYSVVKNIAGEAGEVGLKLHQQWMNVIGYLNAVAPKDPGTNMTMNGSNWLPTYAEADVFGHQYQAAMFPDAYIARVLAGHGHSAGVEALQMLNPAMLEEARSAAIMEDWRGITAEGHAGLSMLFQRPMSALQDPDVFWLIQGQQLPQPIQQAQTNTRPPTGNPAGRPPAVSNKVAGSSVSALINQG